MSNRVGYLAGRATLVAAAFALLAVPLTLLVFSLLLTFATPAAAQGSAQDLYNTARDALQRGDYQAAVDTFSRAVGVDPSFAEAYLGRATTYVYEGDVGAALQDYNQAIQLRPDLAEALYNRGVLRAQNGDLQGAIGDLQRAAQLFRDRGDETTAGLAASALDALQE
jgi:Flp pilus assembly protein TadD